MRKTCTWRSAATIGCLLLAASTAIAQPDAPAAAAALATRVLGERAAGFTFETIAPENGKDVFELEAAKGRVTVRGTTPVAMACGLNWYLKYACNATISWCGNQLNLPQPLPDTPKTRRAATCDWRYYFNYCAFSYTMAWWDWERWEREIDWMALNGINMPLAVTGQEAVWQNVLRALGLDDAAINAFFVGPAYLPFGWMGCMDEWGGPLTQSWIDRHFELERSILARERELGMKPVLQGFTGHVPPAIEQAFPAAKLHKVSDWCGFPGTRFLDPGDPLFARIGKAFVEEQTRLYGTDHLYAADTFIEMSPPSEDPAFLDAMGKAIHGAMAAADPKAVWVMQGWIFFNNPTFWKAPQTEAFLKAAPEGGMLLLDLFCDSSPVWNKTNAFHGRPWVWCIVHNFGGTPGIFGNLPAIATGLPDAFADPNHGNLSGVGMMMEAIEQNPIVYDLTMEMAWRNDPAKLDSWVQAYALRRYGKPCEPAEKAWKLLQDGPYTLPHGPGDVVSARPKSRSAVAWWADCQKHKPQNVLDAWALLESSAGELVGIDTYGYDLVNTTRQALSFLAGLQYMKVMTAYQKRDVPTLDAASARFLEILADMDRVLATRREFLLGKWIEDARRWGDDDASKAHLEWNARNQITLWGPRDSVLHDYARKHWSGLVGDFYAARWSRYFAMLKTALTANTPPALSALEEELRDYEVAWTRETKAYPSSPSGEDPVAICAMLRKKYADDWKLPETAPEVTHLALKKPATCSSSLPDNPALLANDGQFLDTETFWATDVGIDSDPWWQVDLENAAFITRVTVVPYYGDHRYYGFTVETSLDGVTYDLVADHRDNTLPAVQQGYVCGFDKRLARYVRIKLTANSANTGRHLVEVMVE